MRKKSFAGPLLRWFDRAKRDMPWRKTRDPYAIWLSETMLQQTQVETVKPYYHKFLQAFPTIRDLAAAELQAVLRLWAGLGYYRRAKHLHAAAQVVVERCGGQLPGTAAQLIELPGVGRYTAGAVASIAFGEQTAVLDGNVMRVLSRVELVEEPINLPQTQKQLWVMAQALVPKERPGDYNQALMELGSLVCTSTAPSCLLCPLKVSCQAFLTGRQLELPHIQPKKPSTRRAWGIFLLADAQGRLLVLQRPKGGLWEEMWEFPVVKKEKGVNSGRALADVLTDALGVAVVMETGHRRVSHQLSHRRMEYWVYRGKGAGGALRLPQNHPSMEAYQAFRWIDPGKLEEVPMAAVMKKILAGQD